MENQTDKNGNYMEIGLPYRRRSVGTSEELPMLFGGLLEVTNAGMVQGIQDHYVACYFG